MSNDLSDRLFATGTAALQDREQRRREVARDIAAASYQRRQVTWASGRVDGYYIDKYLFETKPTILRRTASLLAELVPPGTDRLAGAQLGGVPVVVALSLETGLPYVLLRRDAAPGRPTVEGEVHQGESVLLIEDVLRSGQHALDSVAALRAGGVEVERVAAVLDLGSGAASALAAAGVELSALLTADDLDLPVPLRA